jgi:hypothetical protein
MALLTMVRPMGNPTRSCYRELTLAEMLSDSIVIAVMEADGVDRDELEAALRRLARRLDGDQPLGAS